MGTLTHRAGDLLAADLPAIAHGCNTSGVMGAGIARQISQRWPQLLVDYRAECRAGRFSLGSCFAWGDAPVVFNLATQPRPGPHASLSAIESSCTAMFEQAAARSIEVIGIPRIGAGIGGLSWGGVEEVVGRLAAQSRVDVVVFTLEEPPQRKQSETLF